MGWSEAQASGEAFALLGTVDPSLVLDALMAGLEAGWMIALSTSRDGGALSISTTADGDRQRAWVTDPVELEKALTRLTAAAKTTS